MFVNVVMTLDAFVGGYAIGLNSRHVLIVDPKLPPYVAKKEATESKKSKTPLPPPPASKIKPPLPKDGKVAKDSASEKPVAAKKDESAKTKVTTSHKSHHH